MPPSKQLEEAIESATHERLRTLLHSICSESDEASKLVSKALLTQSKAGASNKRKSGNANSALRYEVCTQCKQEFDTTTNDEYSCQWHDGELELDMDNDYWADHDEPLEILDSKENRRDHPDGFVWTCCDTLGNGGRDMESDDDDSEDDDGDKLEGCRKGPHRAKGKKRSTR